MVIHSSKPDDVWKPFKFQQWFDSIDIINLVHGRDKEFRNLHSFLHVPYITHNFNLLYFTEGILWEPLFCSTATILTRSDGPHRKTNRLTNKPTLNCNQMPNLAHVDTMIMFFWIIITGPFSKKNHSGRTTWPGSPEDNKQNAPIVFGVPRPASLWVTRPPPSGYGQGKVGRKRKLGHGTSEIFWLFPRSDKLHKTWPWPLVQTLLYLILNKLVSCFFFLYQTHCAWPEYQPGRLLNRFIVFCKIHLTA